MSRIKIEHVTKKYGKVIAINNLSINCEDSEFIVVLGKPGAGKTTLLRMLAGIEEPNEGQIYFNNNLMNGIVPEKRNVAMAFETYALYPHFSVKQNMLSPLMSPNNTIDKNLREKRIHEVSQLLGIEPLLDRKPSQLSGGQRQRISLARALMKAEDVNCVFLDEPISHLDARLRNSLRGDLKKYLRDKKATVIYTTADYAEALGIADRILVIIDGMARMFASPDKVFNEPKDLDIANIIGDPKINIFKVNEKGAIQAGDLTLTLKYFERVQAKYIGVRPFDINIVSTKNLDLIPGTIYVTEPIGYDQIIRVMVGTKMINIKMPLENNIFAINQSVWLDINWKNALIFDNDGILKGLD